MGLQLWSTCAALLLTATVAAVLPASAAADSFFAVLQDPSGMASVVVYNATGDVQHTSSQHWSFQWPLVETTSDSIKKQIYVITFPTSSGEATLFVFNASLGTPAAVDVSPGLSYFDLEFSAAQNAFFGIAVSSRYGRVLSRFFNFTAPVLHAPIVALPYMWFVNASTFDPQSGRYLGLLNNFPGQPNSTSAQKLAVGHYASAPLHTDFLDLVPSSGIPALIRFIAWSSPLGRLYGVSQSNRDAALVVIDTTSGAYDALLTLPDCTAQPIFASSTADEIIAFVHNTTSGTRNLVRFDVRQRSVEVVREFADALTVAAVTRLDW